jgi:hypothetical protein
VVFRAMESEIADRNILYTAPPLIVDLRTFQLCHF